MKSFLLACIAVVVASALATSSADAAAATSNEVRTLFHRDYNVSTPAPPPPMPNFHGYIVLGQSVCDDFLCKDWSLAVTRLDTECWTWDCQYEEKQLRTLIPESPVKRMEFPVFTAFHKATRNFYTTGISASSATGKLFTTIIGKDVNSTKEGGSPVTFRFPNGTANTFVSLEVTARNEVIAIFQDGAVCTVDARTGAIKKRGALIGSQGVRFCNKATYVDQATNTLYATTVTLEMGAPNVVTFDLNTWKVKNDVHIAKPQYAAGIQIPFQLIYIPAIKNIVYFVTGQFDSLVYLDPRTGNTSYLAFDLMNFNSLEFNNEGRPSQHTDDLLKNVAFDAKSNTLYFQCSQDQQGEAITSLCGMPITPGPSLPPAVFININLSPIDFGYQGYHWVDCEGKCPT